MRRLFLCSVLMVSAQIANGAEGYQPTGNYWYDKCSNPANLNYCIGYIHGLVDGYPDGVLSLGIAAKTPDIPMSVMTPYCFPNGVTYRQIADVFVDYMRKRPQERHMMAAHLFNLSVAQSFPCK
ncbi:MULTISPECIES: Rap1a/Tai family immunity protein [unclassified Achromobacter]|uniref:Rap1a/Tai family immunity protein n=1 Tax=unclassified Achromobacter TaxID=2626865 RepID=UPI001177F434|nr:MULTISPECIES: Rap1a/Tai family immunity protein [unclassified Achromobacter]